MNKRFSYTIPQMTRRLLRIAAPVKGLLIISTLASILGNLAQIGLMSSGALLLLASQKLIPAKSGVVRCGHVRMCGGDRSRPLYRRCNLPWPAPTGCWQICGSSYNRNPPSPGSGLPH